MKKNLFVRIMAALGGLTLCIFGLLTLAETFFQAPVTDWVGKVLFSDSPLSVLAALLAAALLIMLGVCCIVLPFARNSLKRRGYVMQKSENGVIGVSVKSIEGLVQTCVSQHEMVAKADISIVERRDGIVILLKIEEAAGLNIPLAVGALQKQIKEYVGTCTGVDVREVRVMVENTEDDAAGSPYAVEKPALPAAPAVEAEEQPAEETAQAEEIPDAEAAPVEEIAEETVEETADMPIEEEAAAEEAAEPVAPASVPVMPVMPEMDEEEDDRPLHQRIFGAEEQPVFVPAPPELMIEPQAEEAAEEAPVEETEEVHAEENNGEIAADAVLEVVEAIAEEAAEEAEIAAQEDEELPE